MEKRLLKSMDWGDDKIERGENIIFHLFFSFFFFFMYANSNTVWGLLVFFFPNYYDIYKKKL